MNWLGSDQGMWIRLAFVLLLIVAGPSLGRAAGPDDSLLIYSVGVNGGAGVYLGNGLVLSVAHVVGGGIIDKPKVIIGGQTLTATVVKESPFEQLDLALLEFDESKLPVSLRLRRMPLCLGKPWPGEEVISPAVTGPVRSHILSPTALPPDVRRFSTVIRDVATTGNSGTGVFEAQRKCLLGIMSRKISQIRQRKDTGENATVDIAKYFVPAAAIAEFMPARPRLAPESNPPVQFSYVNSSYNKSRSPR
jgi:Trypsin-like peptidase domain